jgi:2-polyprenyl-6-methoxyphenol hydroxylase-like FAD-dependent oxidoreductase
MKAIIVGAGIGGLTTALFLNKHGIDCEVFEQAPAIQELGVGINLMPHAIASLDEIGMLPALEQSGIAPHRLFYRTGQGLTVWDEPRGRHAGLPYPQISIHRGRLQRLLYDAFELRAPGRVHVDRTAAAWYEMDGQVEAHFVSASGEQFAAKGDVLIGADGVHSRLRRILFPDEGMPRWSGRLMWRGTANWPKFGDGKHFVVAGSNDSRLVLCPIAAGNTDDTLLTNWVFVYRAAEDGSPLHGREEWQGRADRARCLRMLKTVVISDLDIHALASASENIWEYPMCDRDPLPRWSFGRVTLMGDAAHPMYPFGGNGAAQAILDAKSLAVQLSGADGDAAGALKAYEQERREKVYAVVMSNRQGGPERVIDFALSRLSGSNANLEDVAPFEERKAIVHGYALIAGYSADQLRRAAVSRMC